jgi:hypothetical protein
VNLPLGFDPAQPWLAPYAPRAAAMAALLAQGAGVAAVLSGEGADIDLPGGPLRFVQADAAPPGEAYEAFIFRTAQVPTRDNLHDFYNGLAWLQFPRAKRRLNELRRPRSRAPASVPRAGPCAMR